MSQNRCPRCAAALPPAAQWCTLCFTDLRPAPPPPPPPPVPAAPAAAPVAPVAGVVATAERPVGWPCHGCGSLVPFELSACHACGAPFLPADDALRVPMLGSVGRLSGVNKFWFITVVSTVVTAICYVLFEILGHFF